MIRNMLSPSPPRTTLIVSLSAGSQHIKRFRRPQTRFQPLHAMSRFSRSSVCAFVLLTGCVSPRADVSEIAVPAELVRSEARFRKEYMWAPGDQLEVFVRTVPEVSRTVVVRPDGFITLPLLDDVKAAGLTPMELKKELTKRFAERLLDPEVNVIAIQVPPPMVYVVGEVTTNTPVPLRDATTAIQAIAFAGGFRRSARPDDAMIIRLGEDGYLRAISVSNVAGGQPGSVLGLRGMLLQPDDVIFVPESGRSQLTRFLDDFVTRPLGAITGLVSLYLNFRFIQVIAER